MIDWNNVSDESMRAEVLRFLGEKRDNYLEQAEEDETFATDDENLTVRRDRAAACAKCFRRQAAHYQQAIDLLTKAPMPETNDEAR